VVLLVLLLLTLLLGCWAISLLQRRLRQTRVECWLKTAAAVAWWQRFPSVFSLTLVLQRAYTNEPRFLPGIPGQTSGDCLHCWRSELRSNSIHGPLAPAERSPHRQYWPECVDYSADDCAAQGDAACAASAFGVVVAAVPVAFCSCW